MNTLENLLNETKNIESLNKSAVSKLNNLINNLKTQKQKQNEYEVQIDQFKQGNEFYQAQVKKLSGRLKSKKKIYTQFDLARNVFKRLIEQYEEILKPQDMFDVINNEKSVNKEQHNLANEIQHRHMNINKSLQEITVCLKTMTTTLE
ncbi:uncharacterized protein LOC114334754 [Diabrotica virgifera virgifera]|uniref:Uncharacterized protein LOC114334754 n=1 Tax=Diabrotica virgifera virgifera TaxID=50390 RepID=A0A6P7G703_DIAVI|nr:uncharacterized protein LOC114334754 [Diabrotica virgifera virgifera]